MSRDYLIASDLQYERQIMKLLQDSPEYLADYYQYCKKRNKRNITLFSSLRHLRSFLEFEQYMIPECNDLELKDIPLFIFEKLTEEDLSGYWDQMHKVRFYTYQVKCNQMSSIASFYRFLNLSGQCRNNPFLFFEIPDNKDFDERDRLFPETYAHLLLTGILENKQYLAYRKDENGKKTKETVVLPIPHTAWLKRERLVLRNYAICSLLTETDLRISEIVGLNLSDIDFDRKHIVVPEREPGKNRYIPLSLMLQDALQQYIKGTPLPHDLLDMYLFQNEDIFQWCKENILRSDLEQVARKTYPEKDTAFYQDIIRLTHFLRRQGREGLKPNIGEKALFVSIRGKRMTVRMMEYMVKEMAQTYLPEFEDKGEVSPEWFRKTESYK